MPRRWIDKKSATTYQLVFRPQTDPRIHDEDPGADRVFHAVGGPGAPEAGEAGDGRATNARAALDAEFAAAVRANEGEAAQHGVFYDDSRYDYMQHLRDLGAGTGGTVWVDAAGAPPKKDSLDEALAEGGASAAGSAYGSSSAYGSAYGSSSAYGSAYAPSERLAGRDAYQAQQAVPDAIAGFQPDMDPRLREVLEALDDDAYVDGGDEGFFGQIAHGGQEVSAEEFEDRVPDEDDEDAEGWESDDTAKPAREYAQEARAEGEEAEGGGDVHGDGAFMASFRSLPPRQKLAATPSIVSGSSALLGGRHKKRRGARTASDAFSMTSSSIARTDALNTLDARFEKTLETYEEEDEDCGSVASGFSGISGVSDASGASGVSGVSRASRASEAPQLVDRAALGGVLDEFLGSYSRTGKKGVRKGKPQTGMQQLDEIRAELGRPVGKAAAAATGR